MGHEDEDNRQYKVVSNHEEQYSIWLADKVTPPGWNEMNYSNQGL